MNTQEVIRNVQILGGSIVLLSVAGLAVAIKKGLNNRRIYERPFDPKKVEKLKGKILEVDHTNEKNNDIRGTYLHLRTNDEVLPVHLGPAWYIDRQKKRFKAGDKIQVEGSRVSVNGKEAIVAASVTKGDNQLRLRDKNGTPFWYGWKKI
jgi:DNA helicase TIP49 (TBP-interacting protein)